MRAAELAHLFRALKAPAAARALPKLAQRARGEQWSYERFCEALLSTEVASRSPTAGESRKVFPDPRLAKAVFDRVTHEAHIIDTGTESWRFRHGLGRPGKGRKP
jgi:hypothetical protein